MPVSSMSTEMAMVRIVAALALEVVDQFLGARIVVVDHLAEVAAVLRVHLVEQVVQQDGVVVVAGEDDGLADRLAVGIADAVLHQVAQDVRLVSLLKMTLSTSAASKSSVLGSMPVIFELGDLLVGSGCRDLMPSRGTGWCGCRPRTGRQEASPRPPLVVVVDGRHAGPRSRRAEGVAADQLDRRGGQADLERIEVVEQVAVAVVDAAVRFVGDDQVEEAEDRRSGRPSSWPDRWRDRFGAGGPSPCWRGR